MSGVVRSDFVVNLLFIAFIAVAFAVLTLFVVWVFMRWLQQKPDAPAQLSQAPPSRAGDVQRLAPTSAACPECGAAVPDDSPQGLCAACLLRGTLVELGPTPSVSPAGAPFVAPDAAELAAHFPQLEIVGLIGQGGMGAVYQARQLKLDRFVALKVLPAEWGRDPAFAERFQREARALARLSHPHIVAVHDFGEAGGHFYLLMEFVDGPNLRQLLQTGPLEPRLALQLIPQICDALQYAHEEGVVHRDVKPENILLDARGRVKIADFGLAKLVGPSRASFTLTGTHQVMGTLDYMAPEQRSRPQEVDHRADIYSLGVVFYEMLTGELPLGRFAPPSQLAAVDGRIDDVVFRALEREPERRYQRVSEVRQDVESVSGVGAPAPYPPAVVDAPTPVPEEVQLMVQGPAVTLIVSAVAGLLNWVAALIVFFLPHTSYPDPPQIAIAACVFMLMTSLGLTMLILAGAVQLRRFRDYGLVFGAMLLAMLPWSAACLLGIPAGAWGLWTLSRPDVRAAFAADLRRRRPARKTTPARPRRRSFWRSLAAVFFSVPQRREPSLPGPRSTAD